MAGDLEEMTSWKQQLFDVMQKYRPHHDEVAKRTRAAMTAKGAAAVTKPLKPKKSRGLYE